MKKSDKGLIQLDINMGQIVRDKLQELRIEQKEVAIDMGLSKSAFYTKLQREYFGTVHDLLKLCISANYDFLRLLYPVLEDAGVDLHREDYEYKYLRCMEEKSKLQDQLRRTNQQVDMLLEERNAYKYKDRE